MDNKLEILIPENFDIAQIFDCGQCFRFNRLPETVGAGVTYEGVAFDKYIKAEQKGRLLTLYNVERSEFDNIWYPFFDLGTDYSLFEKHFADDETLRVAAKFSSGIRILRQDKWETLCSFIISQNNNIPRIKGIIENMSKAFGKKVYEDENKSYYSFPTAEALYEAGEEKIFELKTGFRAKYIYDAAKTVCENPYFLTEVSGLETPEASKLLQQIKGVGAKVAACTLLFGFSRYDSFPVDVWVKKVLEKYYPQGIQGHLAGEYAGVAQQYLFYYERCINNVFI